MRLLITAPFWFIVGVLAHPFTRDSRPDLETFKKKYKQENFRLETAHHKHGKFCYRYSFNKGRTWYKVYTALSPYLNLPENNWEWEVLLFRLENQTVFLNSYEDIRNYEDKQATRYIMGNTSHRARRKKGRSKS